MAQLQQAAEGSYAGVQTTSEGLRAQGGKFLRTHPSEDLETALKALAIAEGSLQEVAEHYE